MFVIVPALLAGYHRARGRRRTDARAPSRLRALIRRRPITSFLIMAYAGMWTCLVPAFVLDGSYRLFTAVGALVGLAAPAVVITQLCDGREGLLDLLRRTIRWRVRPWWHLFALYAIPVTAMLLAWLLWGPAVSDVTGLGGVRFAVVLTGQTLLALITIQLLEELAWTGFVQDRLQQRHGALKASLLIAPAFAGIHLPTYFIGARVTREAVVSVLLQLAVITVFAMFFRAMIAWMYNVTARSVLLAATLHASFNTASAVTFVEHLTPAGTPSMLAAVLPLVVVVTMGGVVAVCTRGRLGSPS